MDLTFKNRLKILGIRPKKILGQNFLVNKTVVSKIIEQVETLEPSHIIEVGPGLGALTEPLHALVSAKNKTLTLIELDSQLSRYWEEQKFAVIKGDALKLNWAHFVKSQATLVSNLPYQIASRLFLERTFGPSYIDSMVLMFQREVAQRLLAPFSTKHYGVLSVIGQLGWEMGSLARLTPADFYPSPKVNSEVLVFKRKAVISRDFFYFTKDIFLNRRKLAKKNLSKYLSEDIIIKILGNLMLRAEDISPQKFLKLYEARCCENNCKK